MDTEHYERRQIRVTGVVQGVGFRPFIYRLAQQYHLTGKVWNDSEGVLIEVQGSSDKLQEFETSITTDAPPAAKVLQVLSNLSKIVPGETEFRIERSTILQTRDTMISPDLAICEDCKRELASKTDRRYHYPFINCTNCGPRFTIIEDIPYDRINTTMKDFPMCPKCRAEYTDPLNRRFHAQPNACEVCGPSYTLIGQGRKWDGDKAIHKAKQLLRMGKIIAIKGISGFHLACDAFNEDAVRALRLRKHREDKPFAIMTDSLATARSLASINPEEEQLLQSTAAPIVLLEKLIDYPLAPSVAPHNPYIGIMLPYAPIHCILLDTPMVLVMTSANITDEPIIYQDQIALDNLSSVADYILLHNREIHTRVDDSVMQIRHHKPIFLRRSRGFVPAPVLLKEHSSTEILATGSELKNTFALSKGNKVFISQHLGDLEHHHNFMAYRESLRLFTKIFDINPQLVACDLHPEYISTKFAQELGIPCIEVQHHHAHISSVMAEHHLTEDIIGIALDGTGYGTDGHIWGGEFLLANATSFKRWGHFSYRPLPGGERAIKEPWRLALWQAYCIYGKERLLGKYPQLLKNNWQLIVQIAQHQLNSPLSSSAGRVFDTASALLGVCEYINYEGQAAIELEQRAYGHSGAILPYVIKLEDNQHILDMTACFASLYELKKLRGIGYAAYSFHLTMAYAIVEMIKLIMKDTGIRKIAFSGGVCQNRLLMDLIQQHLPKDVSTYYNHKVPANDGGISLGQIYVASQRLLQKNKITTGGGL